MFQKGGGKPHAACSFFPFKPSKNKEEPGTLQTKNIWHPPSQNPTPSVFATPPPPSADPRTPPPCLRALRIEASLRSIGTGALQARGGGGVALRGGGGPGEPLGAAGSAPGSRRAGGRSGRSVHRLEKRSPQLGALFYRFFFGFQPTKMDCRKKVGTLNRTSLLEDLVELSGARGGMGGMTLKSQVLCHRLERAPSG